MKKIKGDLIQLAVNGQFDLVAHGCNCFCVMGKGIAKSIKDRFPGAYKVDQETQKGDRAKLGTINWAKLKLEKSELIVVNGYNSPFSKYTGNLWLFFAE